MERAFQMEGDASMEVEMKKRKKKKKESGIFQNLKIIKEFQE